MGSTEEFFSKGATIREPTLQQPGAVTMVQKLADMVLLLPLGLTFQRLQSWHLRAGRDGARF